MTQHFIWDIDPNILTLGPLQLRWYGLFFVGSFFLGLMIGQKMFQREGKDPALLDTLLIYILTGTIIGARLAHCLLYEPDFYLAHPLEIFKIWKGGLASHGGMAGVFVATYLFSKRYNFPYMWLLARTTIPGALTAFFIRLGNFFNSEILGLPSDKSWAVVFARVDTIARHPVQLYEAFSYLAIFFILVVIYRKVTPAFATKFLPGFFLTTIFAVRFFLEYIKTKQEDYTIGVSLSTGQLLSLPIILIGVIWIVWALRSDKAN
ncbi:MAG: prolipoprotein diacylglyceryl transferase [Pseudomonadota bacterium]|jgi:prolipoprotein diacylglyceryl transferase